MTIQPDEQTYMIDLTNLCEDQRQILGDEVLQELEKYVVVPSQAFTHFTDITLAAISIHLIAKEKIEATIWRFRTLNQGNFRRFNDSRKVISSKARCWAEEQIEKFRILRTRSSCKGGI